MRLLTDEIRREDATIQKVSRDLRLGPGAAALGQVARLRSTMGLARWLQGPAPVLIRFMFLKTVAQA